MATELGKVTLEEAKEIKQLYGRKMALEELLATIDIKNGTELYEQIVQDFMQTNGKFSEWWKTVAQKYNWHYDATNKWFVDFETGIVSIQ